MRVASFTSSVALHMNESLTNVIQKVMFDFASNSKGNIITSLNTIGVKAWKNTGTQSKPSYSTGTAMILYVPTTLHV